jgi:hypothetical protein
MSVLHLRVIRRNKIGPICNPYGPGTTTPDMGKVTCNKCLSIFEEAKQRKALTDD